MEASYNGNTGQVFGEVALPLAHNHIAYEPFAGLAWVGVDAGGFTETGGIAALTSTGTYDSVGYMTLGGRVAGSMFLDGVELVPRASAAWLHAFGTSTRMRVLRSLLRPELCRFRRAAGAGTARSSMPAST